MKALSHEQESSRQLPFLIVETLSSQDTWTPTTRRLLQFLRQGVPEVWIVDPESRTIGVWQSDGKIDVFAESDEPADATLSPGWRCRIADFFPIPGDGGPPT